MTARPKTPGPELLAPAGGPESLRAAVANGADAVYLGTRDLNARRGAENFDLASLAEHTRHAHLRGARVYLTANVVVLEREMLDAVRLVAGAWEAGVDAVIVQDLGLMRVLRDELPHVRVHASTQVDAHNRASVASLRALGASRVTLSRELSIGEIGEIARDAGIEVESFVHGSLCVCHSGQCLMSSLIGARSANRGLCAQPCRLPYTLLADGGAEVATGGRHLLSTADLAGITLLPALIASGVAALKIEGRMKSPEYVATVVRVYRAALDRALADPESFQVTEAEWDLLSEAFSRGFSEAYLSDVRDDRMMSYARPNNRGIPVGRVVSVEGRSATLALDRAVESEDTLEFWTGGGRHAQKAGELAVSGHRTTAAPAGTRVTMTVTATVRKGDRVFRVANAALLEAARRTYAGSTAGASVPVRVGVRLRVGRPARVTVTAGSVTAEATGEDVETARTRAVTAEDVMDHVGRFGGTPYAPESWEIELDPGVGIGFSMLHALRREAAERLDAMTLAPWEAREPAGDVTLPPARAGGRASRPDAPTLVAAVSSAEVADACSAAGADSVLMSVTSIDASALPGKATPLLPRVAHERECDRLVALTRGGSATSGNLGLLTLVADVGGTGHQPGRVIAADWGLNAVNPWTASSLAELGATELWASPELSGRQVAGLVASSPLPVGMAVHGRLELMVTEHCVLQAAGPCARECSRCARRGRAWGLKDRKGYVFPVRTDPAGRSHVYNSVPLDLSRAMAEVVATGVAMVRLELHTEDPREATRLVSRYRRLIADAVAGHEMPADALVTPSTTGHFFRGVS